MKSALRRRAARLPLKRAFDARAGRTCVNPNVAPISQTRGTGTRPVPGRGGNLGMEGIRIHVGLGRPEARIGEAQGLVRHLHCGVGAPGEPLEERRAAERKAEGLQRRATLRVAAG